MRKTFAVLAGVGLALSISAVGLAQSGLVGVQAKNDTAATTAGLREAAQAGAEKKSASPAQPKQVVWDSGAEEVGKVERTSTTLGYLDSRRQVTFSYPGAEYVKLHFTSLTLLPGDYLTVASPDGKESHRYTRSSAGTWAMSIGGDTARLQLHITNDLLGLKATLDSLGVTVDKVARGFTKAERDARLAEDRARKQDGRTESVCGTDTKADAVCYRTTDPVMYRRSKAVARLLINGTELCTAWRVGPNNRMLTNHHCLETSLQARETEVWFNYQCAVCGGFDVFRPTKVWADQVLATDATHDFTLFSVENFDLVQQFGFLQLDVRAPLAGEELYVPQHPAGAPAEIAVEKGNGNCSVVDPSYDGYAAGIDVSYYCDTEGGSSGSPVLSRTTNRVIALHHFGGCPNSGVRIDQIYPLIATLL